MAADVKLLAIVLPGTGTRRPASMPVGVLDALITGLSWTIRDEYDMCRLAANTRFAAVLLTN